MLAERAAASLSRIATWGPTSEEPALLDATAGGTELPAGLALAVVPVVAVAAVVAVPVVAVAAVVAVPAVAAVPVVLDAEALPVAGLAVEALPVVPAALPAVVAEVPAVVPFVEFVAPAAVVLVPGAVVAALAPGAVTAEPVVELSEAAPAWRTIKRLSKG